MPHDVGYHAADVGSVTRSSRRSAPLRMSGGAPLRVAVLGAGTVGREVVRGLLDDADRLAAVSGRRLDLAGVACRDLDRARGSGIPGELLTDAPAHLVADPGIDVVVELLGGDEPARTLIAAALGAGRPVVTANKHVIAHHGPMLEATARRSGAALRFEASVGGGIPILGTIAEGLAADRPTRVRGIVNGTTNHILTAMAEAGRPYGDVLAEAQALGYAEADPAGDVEGDDAVNKLVILARLAFGGWIDPSTVERRPSTVLGTGRPGITGVSDRELDAAAALGLSLRLLATAIVRPSRAPGDDASDGPTATVLPTAVRATGEFGRTCGVTNRIEVAAEPLGVVALSGPGAGGPATASAVLGDLVAIARGGGSTWAGLPAAGPASPSEGAVTGPRRWFAFVPGPSVTRSAAVDGSSDLTTAVRPDGLGVLTTTLELEAARARIRPLLAMNVDATLYPVDD